MNDEQTVRMAGSTRPIRLGIVDDSRMLREVVAAEFEDVPDIVLVSQGASVQQLLRGRPALDVVALDVQLLDGSDPIENVRLLTSAGYRVLAWGPLHDDETVMATVGAGAAGYVSTDNDMPVIADRLRAVAAGGTAFSA